MTDGSAEKNAASLRYLIAVGCPDCGEETVFGGHTERPVPQDQQITVPAKYCPSCGSEVDYWDPRGEWRTVRVPPVEERDSYSKINQYETSRDGVVYTEQIRATVQIGCNECHAAAESVHELTHVDGCSHKGGESDAE